MKDFGYARANDVGEAVTALATAGTAVIAGGTELLNWMRLGITEPDQVVDIGGVEELRGIDFDGDHLVIGALATLNDVEGNFLVQQHAAALASACRQAASAQLRNRTTIGGNVLQRTRCPYFRTEEPVPWPCNKRAPGSGCASLHGRHERQAVLGWTDDCVAVQPSDPAVALAVLDAEVDVVGRSGRRSISMRDFHLSQAEAAVLDNGPDGLQRENRLDVGELIVAYRVPVHDGEQSAYVKVRQRASYEYAIVSAAASLRSAGSTIVSARVALGSVAQRPWRLPQAEQALAGQPLTREVLTAAVGAALEDARPLPNNAYKVAMARNAAVRALLMAGADL